MLKQKRIIWNDWLIAKGKVDCIVQLHVKIIGNVNRYLQSSNVSMMRFESQFLVWFLEAVSVGVGQLTDRSVMESDTSVLTWAEILAGITFRWRSYC